MAEIDQLKIDLVELQRQLREQAGALQKSRDEQSEALALARLVLEQQSEASKAPAAVFIPRECKLLEFSGSSKKPSEVSIEEWVASMKSAFCAMRVPEDEQAELAKQQLRDEARATVKYMLDSHKQKSVKAIFDILTETYGDKVPAGTRLKEVYDWKQAPGETIRSFAYDLQEKLYQIKSRDPNRVPNAEVILVEQLVLGL